MSVEWREITPPLDTRPSTHSAFSRKNAKQRTVQLRLNYEQSGPATLT